jgi:hypothetical protein
MKTVVVGKHWGAEGETAFVLRSLAGAAARLGEVAVVAPDWPAQSTPDGLFDVRGVPSGSDLRRTADLTLDSVVIVDELGSDIVKGLRSTPFRVGFYLTTTEETVEPPWARLSLVPDPGLPEGSPPALYVPVHPLAAEHRHHGFGFTGYVLVLSDPEEGADPPAAADWIGGGLPDTDVVVVGDGMASAWKERTLRGRVGIDTRTDLWRLMAHATVCIDVAPGPLIGLECIEALRYGTPVIVPSACGPATVHARASSGHTFADAAELVAATVEMQDPEKRSQASISGRSYADRYFGDPDRFVRTLAALLSE